MSIMPQDPDSKLDPPFPRHTIVADLTRDDFGLWVDIPGRCSGYLYGVRDNFNDGYPDRHLTLVDDNGYGVNVRFADSDPSGYPKTMSTACVVALHPMGVPRG